MKHKPLFQVLPSIQKQMLYLLSKKKVEKKPSKLDPYKPYLLQRIKEGTTNCAVLYDEIVSIVTSNKSFIEWGKIFGDEVLATAILDRLLHHATTFNIKGEAKGWNTANNIKPLIKGNLFPLKKRISIRY